MGPGRSGAAWPRRARGWVAVGLTAACVAVLAGNAQLPSLGETIRRMSPDLLAAAFGCSLLSIVCKAVRWRGLYPPGARPDLGLAVVAVAVGQVANWAVPARLGEVLRVGLMTSGAGPGSGGGGVALGVGVLLAEKLLDGFMLLTTLALLAILIGPAEWASTTALLLTVGLGIAALALGLILRGGAGDRSRGTAAPDLAGRLLPRWAARLGGYLESVGKGMTSWLGPGAALQAGLWSAAAWGLGGAVNHLVLRSVGLELGPEAALAVLAALTGAAAVPSLPGRIGVFQSLCVVALLPFGVSFDGALAFSLALYAVVYLPPIALGLLSVTFVGPRRGGLAARIRP
jgi:glycosyltransferase 2 family protein